MPLASHVTVPKFPELKKSKLFDPDVLDLEQLEFTLSDVYNEDTIYYRFLCLQIVTTYVKADFSRRSNAYLNKPGC